jgi:hypothetical protein
MSLAEYLSTEIDQIRHDWGLSESGLDLEVYALAWIEVHAEMFEHDHDRT